MIWVKQLWIFIYISVINLVNIDVMIDKKQLGIDIFEYISVINLVNIVVLIDVKQ